MVSGWSREVVAVPACWEYLLLFSKITGGKTQIGMIFQEKAWIFTWNICGFLIFVAYGKLFKQPSSWGNSHFVWLANAIDLPGLVNIQKAIENGHRNSRFTH